MLVGIPPFPIPQKEYIRYARELGESIKKLYIIPVEEALKKVEFINQAFYRSSLSHVCEDIIKGKIYYKNGYLYGSFSAYTSKELKEAGYKWINGSFKVDLHNSPDIASAVAVKQENDREKMEELALLLLLIGGKVYSDIKADTLKTQTEKIEEYYDKKIVAKKEKQLLDLDKIAPDNIPSPIVVISDDQIKEIKTLPEKKVTVKEVAAITKVDSFSDRENEKVYSAINDEINESIEGFIEKRTERLKKELEKLAAEGKLNKDTIEAKIKREKQIIQNKADFLSIRALNLLRTDITRNVALRQGYTKYRWITRCDDRVRPADKYQREAGEDHRYLHNVICDWNNPPVTNIRTGRTAHPAEDYGCRCVAEIVTEVTENDKVYREGKRPSYVS